MMRIGIGIALTLVAVMSMSPVSALWLPGLILIVWGCTTPGQGQ